MSAFPTIISYDDFLANVNADDLGVLLSFITEVEVLENSADGGDAMFVQINRLYAAGLLDSVSRRYFNDNGEAWQGFLGTLNATAVGYVITLAKERIALSRDPLP